MKKIILTILATIILGNTAALAADIYSDPNFTVIKEQNPDRYGDGVSMFTENGKTGFKDAEGNILIKPEWDETV